MEEAVQFSQKRCLTWFREYTTPDDPDTLGPEGMEKFCEDIGVEPENVVMLVLAYRMQARQMGFFTQSEWLRGLSDLQCDSIVKLQSRLDYLKSLLNDSNHFKAIYRYAYDFARVSWKLIGQCHLLIERYRIKINGAWTWKRRRQCWDFY